MLTRERVLEFIEKQEALNRAYGLMIDPSRGDVMLCGEEDVKAGFGTEEQEEEVMTMLFDSVRNSIDRLLKFVSKE